jgi:hypothetical protein
MPRVVDGPPRARMVIAIVAAKVGRAVQIEKYFYADLRHHTNRTGELLK